jgi:photosystem II stability/assembly factor-like uncharacterized protein
MSFSVSNLSTGDFISNLSGTNGVATILGGNVLYYSSNSGANWVLAQTVSNASFTYIGISGTNAIAMGNNTLDGSVFIYYSTNSGVTWNSYSTGPFTGIIVEKITGSISGSNVICIVEDSSSVVNIFFSTNGGNTWNSSQESSSPISVSNAFFIEPDISGNNAIVCIDNNTDNNIYISNDGGANFIINFNLPSTSSGFNVSSVSISGLNALITAYDTNDGLIFVSNDGGVTWGSPVVTAANIELNKSDINGSVGFVGGINTVDNDAVIYSTTDSGTSWTPVPLSGVNYFNFSSISGSGTNGLAAVETNSGDGILFYTTNSGTSWTQSTTLSGNTINNVSLSNSNGIAGTSNGVYYSSSPLCYEANTLILVLENEAEVYKKVSELKVGDLVKTYKQGYKKVKLLRSFNYKPLDKNSELNFLYKMKDNGVILTAGHSILVDELTKQEEVNNLKYGFNQMIEDKKLLLACSSDKFEKIDDDQEYNLYHFSLESDDSKAHYGVYITDGVLSESCSEEALLRMF